MDSFFDSITDNGEVIIHPELLSIIPFDKIWERDTSKHKEIARKELSWIYFMACRDDKDNIYAGFTDKRERLKIVTDDVFGKDTKWKPDKLITQAIDVYNERNPKNEYELTAEFVKEQLEELKRFIKDVDYSETTTTGALKLDPDKIQKTFQQMMNLTKGLVDFKNLAKEERNRGKIRGGGEENIFENPKFMKE